jgi:hypothetical protein
VDSHEFSHGPGRSDSQGGRPEEPPPPPEADDASQEPIMARLPKSRPKRQSPVRERAKRPAPPPSRTASRAAAAAPHANGSDPAVFGPAEDAPGLPRLALDGAIEAAKLPVKVGANLTFRALDAVTKGLRGR